ncbi:MAG: AAA family ATPase [Deltaproteobacteria bacterium]|nr:AAA family ATPase [Deltaproteobacteria bacterium]
MFIDRVRILNGHFPGKDVYPFNLKIFRETDSLAFKAPVVFFVGENGSGKSTLLEALTRKYGLTVWGGEKSHIVHDNPYETRLFDFIDLEGTEPKGNIERGFLFRAENFFNYAAYLDDLIMTDPGLLEYYGGDSLTRQSHGQGFLSFFNARCRIKGVYFLDEPEAALSPPNQLAFVKALWRIVQAGQGQFIISTHSPIILSYPGAQIFSFDFIPIKSIPYTETHSFRFYKDFMNNRTSYLKELGPQVDE